MKTNEMVKLTIDDQNVFVPVGTTILEAARKINIDIPSLCAQSSLKPFSACSICVVEVKGEKRLVTSCSTEVRPNMQVITKNDRINQARKVCIELLISEHYGSCLSPCQMACPADCDVEGYLRAIAKNSPEAAVQIIKDTIAIPSSIGRICARPCESACRRNKKDRPPAICSLKRFAGDNDLNADQYYKPAMAPDSGKKVAILGGGPAGLNAAYFLKIKGHGVTIFEGKPKAGGYLQYGIPQYRLPKEVLDKEITRLQEMGIEIKCNTKIGIGRGIDRDDLLREGYDAILLAIGAHAAAKMKIDGEDNKGVISGIEYLEKIISGEGYNAGESVIVVGGGNTAIDTARTSLRLGAKVTMLYRRTRNEMPAEPAEIKAAEEEGVDIQYLTAPIKIERKDEKLFVHCIRMQLDKPDDSGRRRPIKIEGSEFVLAVDTVISAIGQGVNKACVERVGARLSGEYHIMADEFTGQTDVKNVFAAGECITGPDIAALAIGSGRRAAFAIDQYLRGEKIEGKRELFKTTMGSFDEIPEEFYKDMRHAKRFYMPELQVKDRVRSFKEVELGFRKKDSIEEAEICLECGCRVADNCLLREYATAYHAEPDRWKGEDKEFYVDDSHPDIVFESNKCILCGCCVRYCRQVKNKDVFGFVNRGFATVIRPRLEQKLADIPFDFALELADICPTGAIAKKKKK